MRGKKMKICATSAGRELTDQIDPRFGRSAYFIFVETDNMEYEAILNESVMLPGGAGIRAAQNIAGKGVKVVISGAMGPNASQVLSSAGISFFTAIPGTVKDNIEAFKDGKLSRMQGPTVPGHFGQGNIPDRGFGPGRGGDSSRRGGGYGRGRQWLE
jgi:predicted Fe-Mo cluster-binding NifX family protein